MVSHYQPGMSYRIRVTGINATTGTLPQFGYQLSAFTGTAGTGAVQAGSFTSLPVSSAVTTIGSLSVLGSTAAISSTGSGTTGDIDTFTVGWVAPPAGSGTVNIYAVVCAANGDAIEGTEDKWNKVSSTFTELLPTNGVASVTPALGISAFPSPVTATLNLRVNGTGNGVYSISAFGLNGHQVASKRVQGGNGGLMAIDMADCAPGLYQVVIEKDGVKQVIPVVKQ
jgi:hypothetical protein